MLFRYPSSCNLLSLTNYSTRYFSLPIFPPSPSFSPIDYIVLADLTAGFKKPCILDVKLGTSSVGEDASPEKKASMEAKDKGTTTHSLGMRLTAMKVYQTSQDDYVSFGKAWGKKVTPETMMDSLSQYFNNGQRYALFVIPLFLPSNNDYR